MVNLNRDRVRFGSKQECSIKCRPPVEFARTFASYGHCLRPRSLRKGGERCSAPSATIQRRSRWALHCRFFAEVLDVAEDRGHGQHLAVAAVTHQAVAPLDIAFDVETVPLFGVPDVIDRNVVMLTPEERDIGE